MGPFALQQYSEKYLNAAKSLPVSELKFDPVRLCGYYQRVKMRRLNSLYTLIAERSGLFETEHTYRDLALAFLSTIGIPTHSGVFEFPFHSEVHANWLFFSRCFGCCGCNTRRKAPNVGILYGAACGIARDSVDGGGIEGGGHKDIRGGECGYSFRGVKSHRA
jgi:hypothetical protein